MVFKRLRQAMGVGGPSIETVLHDPNTQPGGVVTGEITIIGGEYESDIIGVNLALRTKVEVETSDSEYNANLTYNQIPVAGAFRLNPGARYGIPVQFPVPWEAPLTHMYGHPLHGMTVGLSTELEVKGALDPGDLDPIAIHPLPAQERILAAFSNLGFHFRNADCEKGRIHGVHQELPFYQEIEFHPPHQYNGITQLEVTFVANPHSMEVVLELDKRGGLFTEGHDSFSRFTVDYATVDQTSWEHELDGYLQHAGRRRGFF
ncbi:Sporulation-control protein spo0M [Actinomadura rubteroloni]|uniref:Sporulation-control protein spo0M n=1 Tax=Actinomadura rubteroloni TaxID=1926885 RepID=A0A2P4ULG0_9ACTN|nr:sporulation protein [Actinomadura rubteroloni]POM25885.1 Sporulation-control protein spo0M [Actinomadura rubteroloni]